MNFNDFLSLNESKSFNVGDTWEWHGKDWDAASKKNVDIVKKVTITKVEGSKITGKFDGESKEYIIRDADKYLKKQVNESIVDEAKSDWSKKGPMGLNKAETKKVAELYAKAISKADDCKCTVTQGSLEEDSFDLDVDGEKYDGGSYNIYDDGSVVNMAVHGGVSYGKYNDSVDTIVKNLKKLDESLELNEGAVKQFDKDFNDMVKDIKSGYGWIDPEYVEDTWQNSSDSIDFELVKAEIYKRLIKAGLLWHSDEDGEEKGKQVKGLKELGIKESIEINESKITVKRQYTQNYPSKTVGKHAAIRNKVIEALKDGQLTKEEFDQLVSGLTEDSKRWLRRNAQFFNVGEDKVVLSTTGKRILKSINNNIPNKLMETKFIYESFSEFVENKLNENFIVESFASSILGGFIDLKFADKKLYQAFYNYTKVAIDKIEDADFTEMSPSEAYKSKTMGDAVVFYVSRSEKENPYAPEDAYRDNKTIPSNALLAIANGQNEFFGVSWAGRYATSTKYTMKNAGKYGDSGDTSGIGKKYRGWDATGLSNVKRISEVADVAYVLPLEIVRQKYSVEGIRAARIAAQSGATALKTAKSFKEENLARYKSILATRIMNDDLDGKVEKAILHCSDLISKAVQAKEFTRYGEMKLGNAPDGREVTLKDATSFMNSLISDYTEYARYKNDAKKEEERYGKADSYSEKSAKQKAIYIKERIAKLDKLNIAW